MFIKFALFFVLACAAVQGYPQKIEESEIFDDIFDERGLQEIYEKIKEIIEKIKQALSDFGNNIKNVIKQIQDKINEILGSLNIGGIIDKIKDWLKSKLGEVSQNVQECIDEQNDAINDLANDIKSGSTACVQQAKNSLLTLKDDISKFIDNIKQIAKKLLSDAAKCLISWNVKDCLNGVYEQAKTEIQKVKDDAVALINKAKEVAAGAANDLGVCMKKVASDAQPKEQVILGEIKKCVASKNSQPLLLLS